MVYPMCKSTGITYGNFNHRPVNIIKDPKTFFEIMQWKTSWYQYMNHHVKCNYEVLILFYFKIS